MIIKDDEFGSAWFSLLGNLAHGGHKVSPRGQPCREYTSVTLTVKNGRSNFFQSPGRKLQYRFMVAEWLWIWFGLNDVATISRYNPNIAQFSDDGKIFHGAYGPVVKRAWPGIVGTLQRDIDSRQAVIDIYDGRWQPSKDVPCTLSLQFLARRGELQVITCMRSSDVWLGLPYDFYNFSMLGNILAAQLGLNLGSVTMHLGSSHLYERDRPHLEKVILPVMMSSPQLPSSPDPRLLNVLREPADPNKVDLSPPWNCYAQVLRSSNNHEAIVHLENMPCQD